jgi:predicted transcriptional regulator
MTTFTLRLPDELGDALRQTAEREGASMNEIAIKAVALYTSGRVRRRDEHLATIVRQDARLLARLGNLVGDDQNDTVVSEPASGTASTNL